MPLGENGRLPAGGGETKHFPTTLEALDLDGWPFSNLPSLTGQPEANRGDVAFPPTGVRAPNDPISLVSQAGGHSYRLRVGIPGLALCDPAPSPSKAKWSIDERISLPYPLP